MTTGGSLKSGLKGVVIGVLFGIGLAGYVWFDLNGQLSDAQDRAASAFTAHQAQLDDLHEQAAIQEKRVQYLQARLSMSRAETELRAFNYGTANEQIQLAAKQISAAAGDSNKKLATLGLNISRIKFSPSLDSGQQISALQGMIRGVDALIGDLDRR